jgi:peptidase M23-like protein
VSPSGDAHPWPIKPFDRQHPVRGVFGDPRIGGGGGKSFHFGVDVSALDGTAVYAVRGGRVSIDGENITVIEVEGEREHGYWHVVPAVRDGSRVRRGALLGHISDSWGHVHLAERRGDAYWNPLRNGALTPYEDYGAPVVSRIVTSGKPDALTGDVDLVVEAFDHPPLSAPQPAWHGMPVAPALVRWRLVRNARQVVPWRVVFDFRKSFVPRIGGRPPSDVNFDELYAPGTRQNHPNEPGLYRIWLARRFDTTAFADGDYRLDVEAADIRGNASRGHLVLTLVNGQV